MQLLHECTNQHALKIDSSATKRKILQQQQVSYPSSCFAIHIWSKIIYKVALESQYTYNFARFLPNRRFSGDLVYGLPLAWQPWHCCPSIAALA